MYFCVLSVYVLLQLCCLCENVHVYVDVCLYSLVYNIGKHVNVHVYVDVCLYSLVYNIGKHVNHLKKAMSLDKHYRCKYVDVNFFK